jgi:hypothetical protein
MHYLRERRHPPRGPFCTQSKRATEHLRLRTPTPSGRRPRSTPLPHVATPLLHTLVHLDTRRAQPAPYLLPSGLATRLRLPLQALGYIQETRVQSTRALRMRTARPSATTPGHHSLRTPRIRPDPATTPAVVLAMGLGNEVDFVHLLVPRRIGTAPCGRRAASERSHPLAGKLPEIMKEPKTTKRTVTC